MPNRVLGNPLRTEIMYISISVWYQLSVTVLIGSSFDGQISRGKRLTVSPLLVDIKMPDYLYQPTRSR